MQTANSLTNRLQGAKYTELQSKEELNLYEDIFYLVLLIILLVSLVEDRKRWLWSASYV